MLGNFIFQLFATAVIIKNFAKGNIPLVTCLLTSITQDQAIERKSLGLDCAASKDVKDFV